MTGSLTDQLRKRFGASVAMLIFFGHGFLATIIYYEAPTAPQLEHRWPISLGSADWRWVGLAEYLTFWAIVSHLGLWLVLAIWNQIRGRPRQ